MKRMIALIAAFTISTSVFAGNMSNEKDMKSVHGKTINNSSLEDILSRPCKSKNLNKGNELA